MDLNLSRNHDGADGERVLQVCAVGSEVPGAEGAVFGLKVRPWNQLVGKLVGSQEA